MADGSKSYGDWPWKNFTAEDIACKGDGTLIVDKNALDALDRLFEHFGCCAINSAYRSPAYNKKIGGAANSQHIRGRAFDLAIPLKRQKELQKAASAAGFTGFGHYRTFLHVDIGPKREWWIGVTRKDLA